MVFIVVCQWRDKAQKESVYNYHKKKNEKVEKDVDK